MPRSRHAHPTKGSLVEFVAVSRARSEAARAERTAWYDANLACMIEDCFGDILPFRVFSTTEREALEARFAGWRWHRGDPAVLWSGGDYYWLLARGERVGIAGACRLDARRHQGIAGLYIAPGHRGRGYARDALDVFGKAAGRKGRDGIAVDTDWCFGGLIGLYLRLGFVVSDFDRYPTFIRPGFGPRFTVNTSASSVRLTVDGEATPRLLAETDGVRLRLSGPEADWADRGTGGSESAETALADCSIEEAGRRERLATLSLHLALGGLPLVRSWKHWNDAGAHKRPYSPEHLGREIIRWEGRARDAGERVQSPRVAGLPYQLWPENKAPAAPALLERLHRILEGRPELHRAEGVPADRGVLVHGPEGVVALLVGPSAEWYAWTRGFDCALFLDADGVGVSTRGDVDVETNADYLPIRATVPSIALTLDLVALYEGAEFDAFRMTDDGESLMEGVD